MKQFTEVAWTCLLLGLWIFLNIVLLSFVVYRNPNRLLAAGAAGLATTIVGFFGLTIGLIPNRIESWLSMLALGFVCSLFYWLATYWGPRLRGTIWEKEIQTALPKAREAWSDINHKHKS